MTKGRILVTGATSGIGRETARRRKDGTSRLSPFELTDDMVQRAAVMVKLLPEGASAESEPARGGVD